MTIADDQLDSACSPIRVAALPVLGVDPLDTDGRLLRLQPGPTSHLAVASRFVRLDSAMVRLDILSASHRVMMAATPLGTIAPVEGWDVHETVACGSAAAAVHPDRLPSSHTWKTGDWTMSFRSELSTDPDSLQAAADQLIAGADHPAALVASFPGHPLAITGLTVHQHVAGDTNGDDTNSSDSTATASTGGQTSIEWRSWHLYPGDDPHMVTTTTIATRPLQETHS